MGASKNKHFHEVLRSKSWEQGSNWWTWHVACLLSQRTQFLEFLFQFLPDSTSSLPTTLTQFSTWHKRIQLNVPCATFHFSLDILQVDRNSWVQVKVQEVHCWGKADLRHQLGTGLHIPQIKHPYPTLINRKSVTETLFTESRVSQLLWNHLHFAEKKTKAIHDQKANWKRPLILN